MIRRARAQAEPARLRRPRHLRRHARRPDPASSGRRRARAAQRLRGQRARRARGARLRPPRRRHPVGFAPDLVDDGENGFLVDRGRTRIGDRLAELAGMPRDGLGARPGPRPSSTRGPDRASLPRAARALRAATPADGTPRRRCRGRHADSPRHPLGRLLRRRAVTSAARGAQAARRPRRRRHRRRPRRMRRGLDRPGVTHTPAARTCEVAARGARGCARHRRRQHAHDRRRCRPRSPRSLRRRGGPPLVTTRHFASAAGRVGPAADRRARPAVADRRPDRGQPLRSRQRSTAPSTVVHAGVARARRPATAAARERVVLLAQRLEPEKRTDVALARLRGVRAWPTRDGASTSPAPVRSADALRTAGHAPSALDAGRSASSATARTSPTGWPAPACSSPPARTRRSASRVLEAMACGLPVVAARGRRAPGDRSGRLDAPRAVPHPGTSRRPRPSCAPLADDPEERRRLAVAAARPAAVPVHARGPAAGDRRGVPEACYDRTSSWSPWRRWDDGLAPQPAPRRRGCCGDDPTLRVLFVEPPADPMHDVRRGARPRRGAGYASAELSTASRPAGCDLYQGTKCAAPPGRPAGRRAAGRARSSERGTRWA